jgi:hypothetical protein
MPVLDLSEEEDQMLGMAAFSNRVRIFGLR